MSAIEDRIGRPLHGYKDYYKQSQKLLWFCSHTTRTFSVGRLISFHTFKWPSGVTPYLMPILSFIPLTSVIYLNYLLQFLAALIFLKAARS